MDMTRTPSSVLDFAIRTLRVEMRLQIDPSLIADPEAAKLERIRQARKRAALYKLYEANDLLVTEPTDDLLSPAKTEVS